SATAPHRRCALERDLARTIGRRRFARADAPDRKLAAARAPAARANAYRVLEQFRRGASSDAPGAGSLFTSGYNAVVEGDMRVLFAGFVLVLSSSLAFAQQPPAAAANSRTYVSAADVTALIAKAKADRKDQPLIAQSLIQLAPYNVSLEYRA